MTDLLTVSASKRAQLLAETDDENREHYYATSKCPINEEVDLIMEEVCLSAEKWRMVTQQDISLMTQQDVSFDVRLTSCVFDAPCLLLFHDADLACRM